MASFLAFRMCFWYVAILLLSIQAWPARGIELNNYTSPTHFFRTRPELHAPILNIEINEKSMVTPGYIFVAPYRNLDPGPYIYDNDGHLVWSSAGDMGPQTAHNLHVCQYKSQDHICFFSGHQHLGFARGHGVIMNKHYRTVKTIESASSGAVSDMHEFRLVDNGKRALMTVYQTQAKDLTQFGVRRGLGWIVDGHFQEIDVETGELLFEWRSLDHIDPWTSFVFPAGSDTAGDGSTADMAWDYFHINSIDKNEDGDYLISARHTHAIYKISGRDGSILWQLGGMHASFDNTNFVFSSQHDARWHFENTTHTYLSLFDNASNVVNKTSKYSHGLTICIDHVARTATAVGQYGAPEPNNKGVLAGSQGNMQLIGPHHNVFTGWGEYSYISEHLADGTPVFYGKFAQRKSFVMNYRSGKFNWTGMPITKPTLWSYARTGESGDGMTLYVSWNGATEVRSWEFLLSESRDGPWHHERPISKTGFETQLRLANRAANWSVAVALDSQGTVLGRSDPFRTFVPGPDLLPYCDESGCNPAYSSDEGMLGFGDPSKVGFKQALGTPLAESFGDWLLRVVVPLGGFLLVCVGVAISVLACVRVRAAWFVRPASPGRPLSGSMTPQLKTEFGDLGPRSPTLKATVQKLQDVWQTTSSSVRKKMVGEYVPLPRHADP